MGQDGNKQVVRRFVEEYQSNLDDDAFGELMAPHFIDHSRPPGIVQGPEGVRQQFDGLHAAFPDFRATILDQVAEDDKVVTHKVFHGTHEGELMGIPPTGREVEIRVIDIIRVENGQIAEHWNLVDTMGLMQQLGALPGSAGGE